MTSAYSSWLTNKLAWGLCIDWRRAASDDNYRQYHRAVDTGVLGGGSSAAIEVLAMV